MKVVNSTLSISVSAQSIGKSFAIGFKDSYSNDTTHYSVTNDNLGNVNITLSSGTWAGNSHRAPSSSHSINNAAYTKCAFSYGGSGTTVRPISRECVFYIKY